MWSQLEDRQPDLLRWQTKEKMVMVVVLDDDDDDASVSSLNNWAGKQTGRMMAFN